MSSTLPTSSPSTPGSFYPCLHLYSCVCKRRNHLRHLEGLAKSPIRIQRMGKNLQSCFSLFLLISPEIRHSLNKLEPCSSCCIMTVSSKVQTPSYHRSVAQHWTLTATPHPKHFLSLSSYRRTGD